MPLTRDQWQARRDAHQARVRPLVADRLARSGRKHPVYDFLFEYYSFRPTHLLRWSPGVGEVLGDVEPAETDWPQHFRETPGGSILPAEAFPPHRHDYLDWAIRHLEAVSEREPQFGCFGLHEWAMLYRTEVVRHSRVPLRLSTDEIAAAVDSAVLRCTHYDAFRFFTPAAVPLNRWPLTRTDATAFDQPGCVHANMDLYKFAFKLAPFLSAETTADAFELAATARELDMRASPYDLRAFGFEPIRIETKAGRDEYATAQRHISLLAEPVRARVLAEYRHLRGLLAAVRP